MWQLTSIYAKNLCSFREFKFAPKQGVATLIFGNNLDSDSQNSNGSGKSALIEAISIGMTGEPLRKVNIDEIINDNEKGAVISLELRNAALGEIMRVKRCFVRKQPQIIQVVRQTGPYDCDTEEVMQPTVADYNKYILDRIGLTKDDIFSNFILTASKYKSFLSSSDKDKKEIINRFSNGILVDESIEKLHEDMAPVQIALNNAEKAVATCNGRVEALAAEIERAINESAERKATNESRIQNWTRLIADKRADIRTAHERIDGIEESLVALDNLDCEMQQLESSQTDINESLEIIAERLKTNDLGLLHDYAYEIETLNATVKCAQIAAKKVSGALADMRTSLTKAEDEYAAESESLQKKKQANEANWADCEERIEKLKTAVKRLQNKGEKLSSSMLDKNRLKSQLENQLAGVIQCPKCRHEFVLGAELDITEARENLASLTAELSQIAKDIENNEKEYSKTVSDGKNQREIETALDDERRQIALDIAKVEETVSHARQACAQYEKKIEEANYILTDAQSQLSKMRKRIFDEVFEIIDATYKRREQKIKSCEEEIQTLEGSIQSYEKAIEEAREATEETLINSLKSRKEEYQRELVSATEKKNSVEARLNELAAQEATFVEFKTYLANTKINAIAQITNEFLETIGSDIRVALSGYTVLKSGKVRDKISVSLLRDGIDRGSFGKFSAGERVRVELASILSMNQLTNLSCEEGKGLDLLIADEVLDSADECGLDSVFKALNKTHITSLVVSHGQIHEGYPNRITVTKSNGVSSIYENSDNIQ